jgi:hypothetical protein
MPDIQEFVSPVDKSVISSRPKLEAHNRRHGVTNMADYGPDYFQKADRARSAKMQGATKEEKRQRIETIQQAIAYHEGKNK